MYGTTTRWLVKGFDIRIVDFYSKTIINERISTIFWNLSERAEIPAHQLYRIMARNIFHYTLFIILGNKSRYQSFSLQQKYIIKSKQTQPCFHLLFNSGDYFHCDVNNLRQTYALFYDNSHHETYPLQYGQVICWLVGNLVHGQQLRSYRALIKLSSEISRFLCSVGIMESLGSTLLRPHAVICYVMLCYVMLCYVTLRYVTLRYVTLCYVMLCLLFNNQPLAF